MEDLEECVEAYGEVYEFAEFMVDAAHEAKQELSDAQHDLRKLEMEKDQVDSEADDIVEVLLSTSSIVTITFTQSL